MEYKGKKYRKLYAHLRSLPSQAWEASFADVEAIIGGNLPASAWDYSAWWANDATYSQGAAWIAAGWETAQVNMDTETLLFRRNDSSTRRRTSDATLPVQAVESAPNRLNLHQEDHSVMDIQSETSGGALAALDQLQASLEARGVDLSRWARNVQAERRAIDP